MNGVLLGGLVRLRVTCFYHLLGVVASVGEAKGAVCVAFDKDTSENGEPATAGSTSDARSARRVTGGAGLLPCPDCGREFRGKAGVSQHRCRAHPEAYHQDHVPEQTKKARWVYEEKVLLARVGKNMVELGLTVTSKTMAEQFPSRSSEAIKKMRQSAEYRRILESLTGAHGTQDGPTGGSASSLAGLGTHDGRVDEGDSSEAHAAFGASSLPSLEVTREQPEIGVSGPQMTDSTEQCGWSDALRTALEGVHLDLGEVTLEESTRLPRRPG